MDTTQDQPADDPGGDPTGGAIPVQPLGGVQPGVVAAVPAEPLLDGPTAEPRDSSDPAPPLGDDPSVSPLNIPTEAPSSAQASRERPAL